MADELDALVGAALDHFGDDALDIGRGFLEDVVGVDDASTLLDAATRIAGGGGRALLEEHLGGDARELLGAVLGDGVVSLGGGLLDRAVEQVGDEVGAELGYLVGPDGSIPSADEIEAMVRAQQPTTTEGPPTSEPQADWQVDPVDEAMDLVDQLQPILPEEPDVVPEPIDTSAFDDHLDTADAYESSVDSLFEGA